MRRIFFIHRSHAHKHTLKVQVMVKKTYQQKKSNKTVNVPVVSGQMLQNTFLIFCRSDSQYFAACIAPLVCLSFLAFFLTSLHADSQEQISCLTC